MEAKEMDLIQFVPERVSQLRLQRGVSAREMSLTLGQGASFINRIENRTAKPSMDTLGYIIEYFGLTPKEFFDPGLQYPYETNELMKAIQLLDGDSFKLVAELVRKLVK